VCRGAAASAAGPGMEGKRMPRRSEPRDSGHVPRRESTPHAQESTALAEELGMRPLVAHGHHGLGRL
jgi:hypothetical protein